jgi:hypothetical protein
LELAPPTLDGKLHATAGDNEQLMPRLTLPADGFARGKAHAACAGCQKFELRGIETDPQAAAAPDARSRRQFDRCGVRSKT